MKIHANKIFLSLLLINLLTFNAKAEEVVNTNNTNNDSTKTNEQELYEAFEKERQEQIEKNRAMLKKHLLNFYFGPSTNSMTIDYDFEADGYKEVKTNTGNVEVSYLYSVTDKIRFGASLHTNGNKLKYDREDFVADIVVFSINQPTFQRNAKLYQQTEIEINNPTSINFQTEYDFYKINNFSFFGFAELGVSVYNSSIEYDARVQDIYGNNVEINNEDDFIDTDKEYSTTGLNYGGGLGANYAITDDIKFTNKVRYNMKQSVKVLEDVKLDLKPEFSYMLGLTISFNTFYFPRKYR